MNVSRICGPCVFGIVVACWAGAQAADEPVLIPAFDGDFWTVSGDPDLGEWTNEKQQPVDFGVWQAWGGTWQLWSCIRKTNCGGSTRLFYGWEGKRLTDTDWFPVGIVMTADPKYGERVGGLQAPHVIAIEGMYHMFYGDWSNICLATSRDGKKFTRALNKKGRPQLFGDSANDEDVLDKDGRPRVEAEKPEQMWSNTRDAMVLPIGDVYYCYYTAFPNRKGTVYCRTSKDLTAWSDPIKVACGGQAGSHAGSAECPHVVHRHGWYYLFRTQRYGENMQTSVYRSKDPLDFGIDDDRFFVCRMPVAAPEIVRHQGQDYIATLKRSLKGIEIARLKWVPQPADTTEP